MASIELASSSSISSMALYLTCLSPRGWPETAFSGTDLVASSRQSQKRKRTLTEISQRLSELSHVAIHTECFLFFSNPGHFTVLASGIHSGGSFAWAFPWLARVCLFYGNLVDYSKSNIMSSTFGAWLLRQGKDTEYAEMSLTTYE